MKKLIIFFLILTLFFNIVIAQQCETTMVKSALKKALFEYINGQSNSQFSVAQIKDILKFYFNIAEGELTVNCADKGDETDLKISDLVNQANTLTITIPSCSNGTKYGECSNIKPNYCYAGSLHLKCDICGCPSGSICNIDGKCEAVSETVTCSGKLDCGTSDPWTISTIVDHKMGRDSSTKAVGNTIFTAYADDANPFNHVLNLAKSTDGGNTFTTSIIASAEFIRPISLSGVDEDNLYVAFIDPANSALKVAKSTDGGNIWAIHIADSGFTPGAGILSIYAVDSQTIYVAYNVRYILKFAKSTDGGSTWSTQVIENQPPLGFVGRYPSIHAIDTDTVFIGYEYHKGGVGWDQIVKEIRLAKSVDGGNTWEITGVDIKNDSGGHASIDAIDSNTIFIVYQGDQTKGFKLAKSTDGGSTWDIKFLMNDGWTYRRVNVDALDANNIFVAADTNAPPAGIFSAKSTDGGSTFVRKDIDGAWYPSLVVGNANDVYVSHIGHAEDGLMMAKSNWN